MADAQGQNDSSGKHRRHAIYATETSGLLSDRLSAARPHFDSLLARHSLERALTVASVQPEPLLVVVLGPTASGKTALSLALAERFHGEIVNCDSVAMYREFDLGTAKPTASERARAPASPARLRCAHQSYYGWRICPSGTASARRNQKRAATCRSSSAEPASIFAPCLKDFSPVRSVLKNCVSD